MPTPIYLDNHATTRVDPRVVEAMLPFFTEQYGNAASRHHAFGTQAEEAVDRARERIASLIGATGREIVFTSGATESNNLALRGAAAMLRARGNHLVTVVTEHHAVLDPCKRLEREGFAVTVLPVGQNGLIAPEQVAAALTDKTILVSVMAANNEIGVLPDIGAIGSLCKQRGVLFHTDAAQAAGKVPIDVEAMAIDLLSISGHKMFAPKGIGALYVRRQNPRVRLEPLFEGGGHERGMRSGTLPVPLIVGLGLACELCQAEMPAEAVRLGKLRDRLQAGILGRLDEVFVNGDRERRLPGNLNLSLAYVDGEALMMNMRGVAVSSGSACTSASIEPSYVLRALGIGDDLARASIRFGLGRFTTEAEIDAVIDEVTAAVSRLRAISPAYELARAGKP